MPKNILLTLFFLFTLGFSQAKAGDDGFKLVSVDFYYDTITNPRTNWSERVGCTSCPILPIFGDNGFAGASITRDRILQGTIVIEEYNNEDMITRTTRIESVTMKVRATGITFGAKAFYNNHVSFQGLEGRSIENVFNSKFEGWKASIGVGFVLGLNPNYMYLTNSNGIAVHDLESLIGVTGIGAQGLKIEAQFSLKSKNPIRITAQGGSLARTQNQTVPVEEVFKRKL